MLPLHGLYGSRRAQSNTECISDIMEADLVEDGTSEVGYSNRILTGKDKCQNRRLVSLLSVISPERHQSDESPPLVAAVADKPPADSEAKEESNVDSFSPRQHKDPQMADIIQYIETGKLSKEEKRAQEVVLASMVFTGFNVLYQIESDNIYIMDCPRHQQLPQTLPGNTSGTLLRPTMRGKKTTTQ